MVTAQHGTRLVASRCAERLQVGHRGQEAVHGGAGGAPCQRRQLGEGTVVTAEGQCDERIFVVVGAPGGRDTLAKLAQSPATARNAERQMEEQVLAYDGVLDPIEALDESRRGLLVGARRQSVEGPDAGRPAACLGQLVQRGRGNGSVRSCPRRAVLGLLRRAPSAKDGLPRRTLQRRLARRRLRGRLHDVQRCNVRCIRLGQEGPDGSQGAQQRHASQRTDHGHPLRRGRDGRSAAGAPTRPRSPADDRLALPAAADGGSRRARERGAGGHLTPAHVARGEGPGGARSPLLAIGSLTMRLARERDESHDVHDGPTSVGLSKQGLGACATERARS